MWKGMLLISRHELHRAKPPQGSPPQKRTVGSALLRSAEGRPSNAALRSSQVDVCIAEIVSRWMPQFRKTIHRFSSQDVGFRAATSAAIDPRPC